ncbi:hypothetical protein GG344DRAFT_51006 [Lentinula edodes]|nr:hypothetical protein GG344DRAFT_51006 [Lentinula edodes]
MALLPKDGLDKFKGWVHRQTQPFPRILKALDDSKREARERAAVKREFVTRLALNPNSVRCREWVEKRSKDIPTYSVSALAEEYPPRDHWIVESQSILGRWEEHLLRGKQSDVRKTRKELFMLDSEKLKFDILEQESAAFRDEKGELVCVAMRGLCSDPNIVNWADSRVQKNVEIEKNIRVSQIEVIMQKEDAGCIVIAGWSGGAQSKPAFNWVKNLTKKIPDAEKRNLRYEAASVFAVFWNLVRMHGPPEVVDDLEEFVKRTGIYRMDERVHGGGAENTYTVPVNGTEITFDGANMAPPSGVFARNYARPVHRENQPHIWSAAWTTYRNQSVQGGNFYISEYGIRIRSAANTVVFWKPKHYHATSLQDIDPLEKGGPHVQSGLSIVTSARLPSVFRQFVEGMISEKEMVEKCYLDGHDG